jgi:hypothetical protein
MQAANLQARCVHPAAKLAELRVVQGRIEEAGQLLSGFEELPESTHALASLHLANGETAMAAAVLHRRLNAIGGDNVLSAPFLALLVDVQLTQGDVEGAGITAGRLEVVAEGSSLPRIAAQARFARGRVAASAGDKGATELLGAAISAFANQHLPLDAARARFELARALEGHSGRWRSGRPGRRSRSSSGWGPRRPMPPPPSCAARSVGAHRTQGLGLLSRREREVLGSWARA